MPEDASRPAQAAIRTDLGAIFVSMELSRRAWLITSLSPGGGEKMSKHSVPASDVPGLLRRFAELKRKDRRPRRHEGIERMNVLVGGTSVMVVRESGVEMMPVARDALAQSAAECVLRPAP